MDHYRSRKQKEQHPAVPDAVRKFGTLTCDQAAWRHRSLRASRHRFHHTGKIEAAGFWRRGKSGKLCSHFPTGLMESTHERSRQVKFLVNGPVDHGGRHEPSTNRRRVRESGPRSVTAGTLLGSFVMKPGVRSDASRVLFSVRLRTRHGCLNGRNEHDETSILADDDHCASAHRLGAAAPFPRRTSTRSEFRGYEGWPVVDRCQQETFGCDAPQESPRQIIVAAFTRTNAKRSKASTRDAASIAEAIATAA
jgi:hypothetical protein